MFMLFVVVTVGSLFGLKFASFNTVPMTGDTLLGLIRHKHIPESQEYKCSFIVKQNNLMFIN